MADETDTETGDQGSTDATPPAGGRNFEAEIAKLREENAKWRRQYQDVSKKFTDLEPAAARLAELENAQKTETERLAEKVAAMEAQVAQSKAAAEAADRQRRLIALAAKAGTPPELLDYLDASKFDLDDEKAALEVLGQLARSKGANAGGASNPARGGNAAPSDDELRTQLFGGGRQNLIFGG